MSEAITEVETLDNHAALASRLIRTKPALQGYFRWLSRPQMRGEPTQLPSAAVKESLDSLINPLRVDVDRATQRETETASLWLGSICEYIAGRFQTPGSQSLTRLIAASLLPLYRSLASGRLQEGLAQTRHRLGETLVFIGLKESLQLKPLIDSNVTPQLSPHRMLSELLKLDLLNIHYLICHSLDGYNQARDQFNDDATELLKTYRAGEKLPVNLQVPDWAAPQLLWVLTNELTSTRSELVLPRSWIDVPVPWSKISTHWLDLESHLVSLKQETVPESPNHALNESSKAERTDSIVEDSNSSALDKAAAIVEAGQMGFESLETMEVLDRVIEKELFKQPSRPVAAKQPQASSDRPAAVPKKEPLVIPKVLIGEITNHNDPAFANVVRRQVAVCKQEDRSICLSMILVTAEDHRESHSLSAPSDNGLNRWQQKLVNWICDHPELKQPSAFITRDGQLILVVMDAERNEMTRILRQGLVEVLTGQKNDGHGDLATVNIPAKFHAGISSITSPGASFEFEELIASSHRCFNAAQRLGGASIKSIEVF